MDTHTKQRFSEKEKNEILDIKSENIEIMWKQYKKIDDIRWKTIILVTLSILRFDFHYYEEFWYEEISKDKPTELSNAWKIFISRFKPNNINNYKDFLIKLINSPEVQKSIKIIVYKTLYDLEKELEIPEITFN